MPTTAYITVLPAAFQNDASAQISRKFARPTNGWSAPTTFQRCRLITRAPAAGAMRIVRKNASGTARNVYADSVRRALRLRPPRRTRPTWTAMIAIGRVRAPAPRPSTASLFVRLLGPEVVEDLLLLGRSVVEGGLGVLVVQHHLVDRVEQDRALRGFIDEERRVRVREAGDERAVHRILRELRVGGECLARRDFPDLREPEPLHVGGRQVFQKRHRRRETRTARLSSQPVDPERPEVPRGPPRGALGQHRDAPVEFRGRPDGADRERAVQIGRAHV